MDANEGCGVVVGSRTRDGTTRTPLRWLMGEVFAALTATCVSDVADTQCGFKLLTREAARVCMPSLRVRRWAYDVELLYLAQSLGYAVASCPVPSRDVPGSKIKLLTPAEMFVDVARVSVLYRVGRWKLPDASSAAAAPLGSAATFAEMDRGARR